MAAISSLTQDKPRTVVMVALLVIAVHLVNASLFHLDAPLVEKIAWAALALFGVSVAAATYGSLGNAGRGLLALAFALPAGIVGVGIHAVHVHELGVENSSYTGIPMLVAGVLLLLTGGTILVRSVHDWWRRLAFIPITAVFAFFVLFPITLAVAATNVARVPTSAGETPADRGLTYENVSFETERGLILQAWFVPSTNGAMVITVHGAGNNRSTVLDEAEMLARHGYGVLMVDLEGFGDSQGRANAFGWVGARGVHAATAYLASRPDIDPSRIGGLGLSMGGEVLLQAAGESTHLSAVVAEGATGRTAADFRELKDGGDIMYVFHTVVGVSMELITGEKPPPPLKQLVQRIAPRRVLLIGANVSEELDLMTMYHELGGPSFELWFIPEAKHVGAFDLHPEEYEQRVVSFFDSSLLGERPLARTPR